MNKESHSDHSTTDRLSERAHESVDQFAKTAAKGEERFRHHAADAEAGIRHAGEQAKDRTDDILKSVGVFVRDKPLASLGLAFAAGTLLSAVLRHRS